MRSLYKPLMSIAPEGWVVILVLAIGAESAYQHGSSMVAACLLALLVPAAIFFRDVNHSVPGRAKAVLAPADAIVVHRRECFDPLLEREAIRITLRLDWWGAYCLRAPIEGDVYSLPANPRGAVSRIHTDEGEDIVVQVVRGTLFGARPVMVPYGERVGQGRRCGVRRLAREIDLLLPPGARVEVSLGQRVRSGQTPIATLLRRT